MSVGYAISDFSYEALKVQPTGRHLVTTTAVIGEDAFDKYDGDVVDVSDLPASVESALRTAIDEGGDASDTRPVEVLEYLDGYDYVYCGDCRQLGGKPARYALTHLQQYPDRPPLVEFSATLRDPGITDESPGLVAFTLTNTSEMTVTVFGGQVAPFSLLRAASTDATAHFLLWRDEFDRLGEKDGDVALDAVRVGTTIPPREQLTRVYSIDPAVAGFSPGRYEVDYSLSYHPREYRPKDPLPPEIVECTTRFTIS